MKKEEAKRMAATEKKKAKTTKNAPSTTSTKSTQTKATNTTKPKVVQDRKQGSYQGGKRVQEEMEKENKSEMKAKTKAATKSKVKPENTTKAMKGEVIKKKVEKTVQNPQNRASKLVTTRTKMRTKRMQTRGKMEASLPTTPDDKSAVKIGGGTYSEGVFRSGNGAKSSGRLTPQQQLPE